MESKGFKAQHLDLEQKKLYQLRLILDKEDPSTKGVDDMTLSRFLRARDLNVDKAFSMFLKFSKWRKSEVPNGFISSKEISNQLSQKKIFVQGFDKIGRPIGVAFGSKHIYTNGNLEDFKRFVIYTLDKLSAITSKQQEKFVIIGDLRGWGYANCDIKAYLAALSIMQDFYPERLGKLFLVNVPSIFLAAWKIVYPFIDKNTKKKFIFVENRSLKATLQEDIDESQLPEIYGGKLPLIPIEGSSS